MITSKTLIGSAVLLLALSVVFGILNASKTRSLRTAAAESEVARVQAVQARSLRDKEIKTREAASATNSKSGNAPGKSNAEAELAKSQAEKTELQTKLRANEAEIADLRKRIEDAGAPPAVGIAPSSATTADLQAQLEDAKKQLDAAEREKTLLSDKIQAVQGHSNPLEPEKKRRPMALSNPGLRGTVLAVNQAYNFVVLNLGGRQGVEPNSEMLVLRGGALIGKIRISSVEPTTAIGDIISSSLARGVQVQPGDIVVYAGTNS